MAIIENTTNANGDVLVIKPEVPIVGIISLYDFVDTTQGENYPTDYYQKLFRYSVNGGITFSDWMDLTLLNIQNLNISKQNQFVIEYQYIHVGTTPGVTLSFEDILVSGNFVDLPYPIYNGTYFNDFFPVNDLTVYGWALNVLEKLYQHGLLPEYMERGRESSSNLADQDFLMFWNTITHYFAILVYYARQYRNISTNTTLIEVFLNNKGLESGNTATEDLVYLFNNYIQAFADRGTNNITTLKSVTTTIDGEFLRLIGFTSPEEFIFALLQNFEIGWCMGLSSPCWDGTENMTNLIKAYEYTKDVVDLTKYPLTNPTYISINGADMLIQNVPLTQQSGIYEDGDVTKQIPVNKNLDYEISFFCKLDVAATEITFGLKGYDSVGNNVNFVDMITGINNNNFFTRQTLNLTGQYYWIRGILYNQNQAIGSGYDMFPNGRHLKFSPSGSIKYIVPHILLDNTGSVFPNAVRFWNIKVRPLKTPFTRGQLGIHNVILSYLVNNNSQYTTDQLEYKAKQEIIPANSFLKIKYL